MAPARKSKSNKEKDEVTESNKLLRLRTERLEEEVRRLKSKLADCSLFPVADHDDCTALNKTTERERDKALQREREMQENAGQPIPRPRMLNKGSGNTLKEALGLAPGPKAERGSYEEAEKRAKYNVLLVRVVQ